MLSGRDFDKSLRNGQAAGRLDFPKFGKLLAATQTGGPHQIPVDLSGVRTPVIGIFVCTGQGAGPTVGLADGHDSLLWFRSDGCDDTNLYSGQSKPLPSGHDRATLTVTVPKQVRYSFVLEQVADT